MRTGLDPASLGEELRGAGLVLREQLGPAEIQARYFEQSKNGYSAFEHVCFAAAEVG